MFSSLLVRHDIDVSLLIFAQGKCEFCRMKSPFRFDSRMDVYASFFGDNFQQFLNTMSATVTSSTYFTSKVLQIHLSML